MGRTKKTENKTTEKKSTTKTAKRSYTCSEKVLEAKAKTMHDENYTFIDKEGRIIPAERESSIDELPLSYTKIPTENGVKVSCQYMLDGTVCLKVGTYAAMFNKEHAKQLYDAIYDASRGTV